MKLRELTEAVAVAVAREIAAFRSEVKRERELFAAEMRASRAEWEARLAAVSETERRLAERLAALKDGEPGKSVAVADVLPIIHAEIERRFDELPVPEKGDPGPGPDPEAIAALFAAVVQDAVASLPPAEKGEPGKSVTVAEVEPLIAVRVAEAVAAMPPVEAREIDPAVVERMVAAAVAAIPRAKDGDPGTSVTLAEVEPVIVAEVARLIAALPAPKDGEPGASVTIDDVAPLISSEVAKAVAALPPAEPGKPGASVDPGEVEQMVVDSVTRAVAALPPIEPLAVDEEALAASVRAEVGRAVAALPPPKDGDSVTAEELAPMVEACVDRAIAAIPKPTDGVGVADAVIGEGGNLVISLTDGTRRDLGRVVGADGKRGKLPIVVEWEERVFYSGDVATRDGASYQALRDTGRAPPHEDWICIAKRGRDGENGRSLNVRGTWDENEASYAALDIVALGGASFIAKRDAPGVCPGEGWQLLAMQGKRGKPGEPGKAGVGLRGLPGVPVVGADINGEGLLTLTNGDGSEVTCDLYPLLSKVR